MRNTKRSLIITVLLVGMFFLSGAGQSQTVLGVEPPGLPADPVHQVSKNRYISLDAGTNGVQSVALQFTLRSMKRCSGDLRRACVVDDDCSSVCDNNYDQECITDAPCSGGSCIPTGPCVEHPDVYQQVGWVGEPFETVCVPQNDCVGEWFGELVSEPVFRVWSEDPLHVTGCAVVPVALYEVRACLPPDGTNCSSPLVIQTTPKPDQHHYGDVAGAQDAGGAFTPPDGFVNPIDLFAVQRALQGLGPHTTWVDLHGPGEGSVPNQIVDISDLAAVNSAVQGLPYAASPGQVDPCDCVSATCSSDLCGNGQCNQGEDVCSCPDDCGSWTDCDGDGIPDECGDDCNGNGLADSCDIVDGRSEDCNDNGIPDECDVADDPGSDCNGNGNGIPDECEPDCQQPGEPGSGTADSCDIAEGTSGDSNDNTIPDECEPGACCYTWGTYFMCDDLTESECDEQWGFLNSTFKGLDTACPTEGVYSTEHHNDAGDIQVVVHVTDVAQTCGGGKSDCIPGDPIDPWITALDAQICHQFDAGPSSPPIPADFFGPGSEPFSGQVCLVGEPLGPTEYGEFGDADTLIRRAWDPFSRCDLPSPLESGPVETEVIALNLVSLQPITVTYGGSPPEQWDVTVDVSDLPPADLGWISAVKTHCNGGTYSSELHVQPRFTFTRLDDPGETRVLDTGLEGIPYVKLVQEDGALWTSDLSENFGFASPICSDFHPGIEDPTPCAGAECCDCDNDGVMDKCEIDDGAEKDCNTNGIPDKCELTSGASQDCNANNVPDQCDIASQNSQDCNADFVPDECTLTPPAPAQPPHNVRKNRYISFAPDNTGCVAFQVELTSMKRCSGDLRRTCDIDADCPMVCANDIDMQCEEDSMCVQVGGACVAISPCVEHPDAGTVVGWVGEPFIEPEGCKPLLCTNNDWVARVVSEPVYRRWNEPVIHIGDCEIVPVATYHIQATADGVLFSDPVEVGTILKPGTRHYADIAGPVDAVTGAYTPADGFVNVVDVQAYLLTVKGPPNPRVHTTWADLHGLGGGSPPNSILNVADLQRILFGFVGKPYTATPEQLNPSDCP